MLASAWRGPHGGATRETRTTALFDVGKAQCFKEEEFEKILGIIKSGFGSFEAFLTRWSAACSARASTRACAQPRELSLAQTSEGRFEQAAVAPTRTRKFSFEA